jgi:hypothetical protein
MSESVLYTEKELAEIDNFLQESYMEAAITLPSARKREPGEAAKKEVDRLRMKSVKEKSKKITDKDIDELTEAIHSPFASDFSSRKQAIIEKTEKEEADLIKEEHRGKKNSFSWMLLKHFSKRICGNVVEPSLTKLTISTASLSGLMQFFNMDPLFAPVIIWVATKVRNESIMAFCESVQEYIEQKGI